MENLRSIATRLTLIIIIILGICFQGIYYSEPVYAWNNVGTHPTINGYAYDSFLSQWMPNDQYLKQASLDGTAQGESWDPADGGSWTIRKDPQIREKSIKDWLIEGGWSADEPELSMSLVHFYDPVRAPHYLTDYINDLPAEIGKWYNPTTDAYQWAFESTANPFSFINGEQNFQIALASKDSNDINYGKAWRAVGETMHLISDMTVPAHVRNDAHIPYAHLWDPLEYFTYGSDVNSYSSGAFPATPSLNYHADIRDLFKQTATWTNQHFLSADTVPQYNLDITPNGKKAYPSPAVIIDPNQTGYYTTTIDGNDKFPLARASIAGILWKTPSLVVDQTVCSAQRSVLLPTAIKVSAAVMDAFLPRFEVTIDNVHPDTVVKGNYMITAHIKQIPTKEWPNSLIIRNGANIMADSKDNVITMNNNLDNNDNLNTISYSITAKEGSSITVYYDLGGYKISSAEYTIPTSNVAVKSVTYVGDMTHSNEPQHAFGTPDNPYSVTLSGKLKGDPALQFKGVEYYKQFGIVSDVMAFVWSIPKPAVTSSTTSSTLIRNLGADGLSIKFGNPKETSVVHTDTSNGVSTTTTITWLGWGDGQALVAHVNYQWSNGGSITRDMIAQLDTSSSGEGENSIMAQVSSTIIQLTAKIGVHTHIVDQNGHVSDSDTTNTGPETIVIRLVPR